MRFKKRFNEIKDMEVKKKKKNPALVKLKKRSQEEQHSEDDTGSKLPLIAISDQGSSDVGDGNIYCGEMQKEVRSY